MTDNPSISEPPLRGPFLTSFNPPTFKIITATRTIGVPGVVNVPVSFELFSDDAGNTVQVYLQRDFLGSGGETSVQRYDHFLGTQNIPPGDFDHERTVSISAALDETVPAGCHSLTAIVAYDWDATKWLPSAGSRSASVTWWLDLEDGSGNPTGMVSSCPGFGAGGSDASADGGNTEVNQANQTNQANRSAEAGP